MKILLVNDDGYLAEGILTLDRVLSSFGHQVLMVAPHTGQSAKSHSMTLGKEIIMHRHDERHYSLEGTPADCIIFPLRAAIIEFEPEVVISGINHGLNAGTDFLYSGTCGAARQAAVYGYKAIAVSTDPDENGTYDFETPARHLAENLTLYTRQLNSSAFLSLNYPPRWNGRMQKAELGVIRYTDHFQIRREGELIGIRPVGGEVNFRRGVKEPSFPIDTELLQEHIATASLFSSLPQVDSSEMLQFELQEASFSSPFIGEL